MNMNTMSHRYPAFIGDLAKEAGVSRKVFIRSVENLERDGWLTVERVTTDIWRIAPTTPKEIIRG